MRDDRLRGLGQAAFGQVKTTWQCQIMVSVGRSLNLTGFGVEGLGPSTEAAHLVLDAHCATSMRGVYAIGDITGDPMRAHCAVAQGVAVAEHLVSHSSKWDKRCIPAVCFTDPDLVVVGELPSAGSRSGTFPLAASGRAMTMECSKGFQRLEYDEETELVLGMQPVGASVSELADAFALAIEMCATLRDLADTIHAHPTLGETTEETAHVAMGHALHL